MTFFALQISPLLRYTVQCVHILQDFYLCKRFVTVFKENLGIKCGQSTVSHDGENTACPRQPQFSQHIYLFSLGDCAQSLRFSVPTIPQFSLLHTVERLYCKSPIYVWAHYNV
jgi:hypothetical protein